MQNDKKSFKKYLVYLHFHHIILYGRYITKLFVKETGGRGSLVRYHAMLSQNQVQKQAIFCGGVLYGVQHGLQLLLTCVPTAKFFRAFFEILVQLKIYQSSDILLLLFRKHYFSFY